jgi:hypothetical protein
LNVAAYVIPENVWFIIPQKKVGELERGAASDAEKFEICRVPGGVGFAARKVEGGMPARIEVWAEEYLPKS